MARPKSMTEEKLAKIAVFRSMWAEGKSYKEISDATGISVSALGSSRERWGMPARIRPTSEANRKAEAEAAARKFARTGSTLEPLPSLAGIEFPKHIAPTDVKIVSHKFLPDHKCAWPIENGSCGRHCDKPGPYCNEHRAIAYLTPDEAENAWKSTLGYHPAKR
jgi:hypothetical protein